MKKFLNLDGSKTVLNLFAIQGFYWFAWAFSCYGTVYLQNVGFKPSTIGTLNACCSAIAIVSVILWGMLSDKINSIKYTLIIAVTMAVTLYGITPLLPTNTAHTVVMFFIYYGLTNVFRCCNTPLLDNLTIRTCTTKRLNYGIIRAFGSFTFTIGSFLVVLVIGKFGLNYSFLAATLCFVPTIICMCFSYDPKVEHKSKKVKINPKELFKNYYYVMFLIFAIIFSCATTAEFSFITYFMEEIGVSNSYFGSFLAVRAIAEIPLLLFIVKIRRKLKLKYLFVLGVLGMALQCLCLSLFANNLRDLLVFSVLFGLGNGTLLGIIPVYLYKLSPAHLRATAQTMYSSMCAVAGIIGNLLGGIVYELLGGRNFYLGIFAVLSIALTFFFVSTKVNKGENPANEYG